MPYLKLQQAGEYVCRATNILGSINATFELRVSNSRRVAHDLQFYHIAMCIEGV